MLLWSAIIVIIIIHHSVAAALCGTSSLFQKYSTFSVGRVTLTLNGETSLSYFFAVTLLPLGQFSPKMFVLQTRLSHQTDKDNCAYKTNIFLSLHLQWFCSYFQKCHKKSLKSLPIRVY